MTPELWVELQEGLLFVFGPVWFWSLVFIVIGALLTAIGVILMEDLPRIDPL